MNSAPLLPLADSPTDALAGAQLQRLVLLRWVSVFIMLALVFPLAALLNIAVPAAALLAVACALVAANFFTLAWLARGSSDAANSPRVLFAHLLVDITGWSALLYFTGGATNPLISMLLPLVAIGAAILPATLAWLLAALAIGAYSLLWSYYQPIRIADDTLAMRWHLAGMWLTFALSAAVIVGFVVRMTAALRDRDRALAAANAAISRDEHIVALGNLAAGAAHNLGTPLGTMRIVTDELAANTQLPADVQADVEILRTQVDQCRKILALLTAQAGALRAEGGQVVSGKKWIEETVTHWQQQRPHARAQVECGDEMKTVDLVVDATLTQALHTLVNNAADASPQDVSVHAGIVGAALRIEVLDRGAGAPRALLDSSTGNAGNEAGSGLSLPQAQAQAVQPMSAGSPVTQGTGMGIGLILARNTLARYRGTLAFSARVGGGTVACMIIPLEHIRA